MLASFDPPCGWSPAPAQAPALPSSPRSQRGLLVFFAAMALVLCALVATGAFPQMAWAKSYECPQVEITAQAQTDGSLHIVEQRTFDFSGSFSAVWWEFAGLPSNAKVSVGSMRMAQVDEAGNVLGEWEPLDEVPFLISWREEGGPGHDAWSFDEAKNMAYAFFDQADTRVVIELDYTVKNGAQAYDDIAEIYWKYVPEGWAVDSRNVSVSIELPVPPDTAVVPGDNVRAWGHGPLDGSVTVEEDGSVLYDVPLVRSGQYAEARVVFPVDWLTNLDGESRLANQGTTRLDTVLSEEKEWADEANSQRAIALQVNIAMVAVCVVALALSVFLFARFGREHEPDFTGDYWRDVPAPGVSPAVIGRLWRWGHESRLEFPAVLMSLAHKGALRIGSGSYAGKNGKPVDDYYLVRVDEVADGLTDPVEQQTMRFLFDTVAQGAPSLWLGSIRVYGEKHPQEYVDAMQDWQGMLTAQVNRYDLFEMRSKRLQTFVGVLAALFIVAGVVAFFWKNNFIPLVLFVPTGAALAVIANYMPRRTEYGNNITARAKALRNWLRDFTSLDERPPTDVKVWGEFMVYAYLFGVADQAMKNLREAVPEVLAAPADAAGTPAYVPWYVWYGPGVGSQGSPMPSVADMVDVSVSNTISSAQAALSAASGHSSSGGGFGGGFSVGGGGGFGGGGGAR